MKRKTSLILGIALLILGVGLSYLDSYIGYECDSNAWWFGPTFLLTMFSIIGALFFSGVLILRSFDES